MKKIIVLLSLIVLTLTVVVSKTYAMADFYNPNGYTLIQKSQWAWKYSVQTDDVYFLSMYDQDSQIYNESLKSVALSSINIYGANLVFPLNSSFNVSIYDTSTNDTLISLDDVALIGFQVEFSSEPLYLVIYDTQMNELERFNVNTELNYNHVLRTHKTYGLTEYEQGFRDGEIQGFNTARQQYGFFDVVNNVWKTATERFNEGLNLGRSEYGIFHNGIWYNATDWGNIRFQDGQNDDFNYYDWMVQALVLPGILLNVEIFPGVKLGYFILLPIVLGVVGWILHIVGKRG